MTKPAERLEKTLARIAKEQGLDQERLRRWVSFLALCGVLERAIHEGILGTYYLKGGVALELRFAGAARATKDMDLGLDGSRVERLKVFEQALALGFDVFAFRLKSQSRSMDLADTIRVEVAVQHRTRAWQTIEVDLGPAGAGSIDFVEPAVGGLAEMGLPITSPIRCLGLSEQLAQKLHACTGPYSKGRARGHSRHPLDGSFGEAGLPKSAGSSRSSVCATSHAHIPSQYRHTAELAGGASDIGEGIGLPRD